ncbi:pyridoxal phosphate-dependent decarboxylase family protein [Pedobacter heparinus]|uniref:pyridoxal phosphate-dependent decarboxylase family protein n=1 Tax=Pedobacter heparinus TaxID=984 RepID=UPI002931112C|nr:pyridoxal-dependent decarboxylase [Pedobacter heparinus]
MNELLKQDLLNIAGILEQVKVEGLDFLNGINGRPTSVDTPMQANPALLEERGMGTLEALKEFKASFDAIIVAAAGPRYWGFVTGGTTPAAIAGDWLTSVYDQNTQSIKGQGDVSALIELDTIQLLLQLLGLPDDYTAGFVTGATMANFTCLAVARQWAGKQLGLDVARNGVPAGIKVLSAMPHSSAVKSLAMLGIGSQNFIKLQVLPGNREAMAIADLEAKIQELDGQPFILISSAGTVNTVDFDDFEAIFKLRDKYNFWWHIDAAFGAFAACAPDYRHLLKDWEQADSITVDCHKWLNVPYENAFFLIRKQHQHLQVESFQNSNAPYLGDPMDNFSYLNFLPENSRRLKALPAWLSLKAYGRAGQQDIVIQSIAMAKALGDFIANSTAFELLAPVRLNTVCFTLKGDENQDKVFKYLHLLNEGGRVFMTPTVYQQKNAIRAAFVNWRTSQEDMDIAIAEMENALLSIFP